MRNTQTIYILLLALTALVLSSCGGGGGPTGPSNPPQLTGYLVENEQEVRPGSTTIVVRIDYIDMSRTMQDGVAYITYSEGTYTSTISNAAAASGTMLISFDLSPLVKPGELLVEVWVQNGNGESSNTIQILLNVT
ncbi:hypothetical protein CSB45_03205 [candidate division KSB3 bacterium]|uniref:Bacterial spore germination immunoglobulin-like domain-containing protein n=1 Tax=candidate division KSB3 bacterium TaxID=2044937 RepID=A0A2G6E923_9BACT|nr:MAG: hypothetical protein CSB45_03205 [candidate division KSB3 bacterium]PIE28959.1 MAG: hypothetical protein CSA57_10885 [candidate division KSB3 bacterium]